MNPTQSLFKTRFQLHGFVEGVGRDVVHPALLAPNEQNEVAFVRSVNSDWPKPPPGGMLTRSRFIDVEPDLAETLVGLVEILEMNDWRLNPVLGRPQDLQ